MSFGITSRLRLSPSVWYFMAFVIQEGRAAYAYLAVTAEGPVVNCLILQAIGPIA